MYFYWKHVSLNPLKLRFFHFFLLNLITDFSLSVIFFFSVLSKNVIIPLSIWLFIIYAEEDMRLTALLIILNLYIFPIYFKQKVSVFYISLKKPVLKKRKTIIKRLYICWNCKRIELSNAWVNFKISKKGFLLQRCYARIGTRKKHIKNILFHLLFFNVDVQKPDSLQNLKKKKISIFRHEFNII